VAGEARIGSGRTPSRRNARPAGETEPRVERRGPIAGLRQFVLESWAELQKVEWPKQNQIVQGTVVVLVACVIVGTFLYLNDELWKTVVQKVLLK
jgi:preprotein translocase SecE subunit